MIPTLLTDSISFDLNRAIHYALLWGLEAVELRAVGGPGDRVPFVNEQKLKRRLQESDLPVQAIVPGMFEGDLSDRPAWLNELALLDETLQFCTRLDCRRIVVSGFTPGAAASKALVYNPASGAIIEEIAGILRRAAVKSSRTSTQICIANGVNSRIRTGRELAALLDAVDHPAVTAAWSPDEALMAGEQQLQGLEVLENRIGIVRCRNVARIGNGWEPRTIDKGAVDWAGQIERLQDARFSGPLSLEVRVEPRARNGLREATELIRLVRQHRRLA